MALDKSQYVATTCWFVEAHAKFVLYKHCSRERTVDVILYNIHFNIIMFHDTWEPNCLKIFCMILKHY